MNRVEPMPCRELRSFARPPSGALLVVGRAPLFPPGAGRDGNHPNRPPSTVMAISNAEKPSETCDRTPEGWACYLGRGHDGPCPAWPVDHRGRILTLLDGPPPRRPYRPTWWSTPWLLLLPLIGYEFWTLWHNKEGGPLSHVVWWLYGDQWTLRWWLWMSGMGGLGVWAWRHFAFQWGGPKELALHVGAAMGVGLLAWLFTCVKW